MYLILLFTFLCAGCSRCALSSLRWLFLFFKFLATGCSSCSLSRLFWCSLSLRWQELFPRCAGCSCCSQPRSRWLFLLLFNFRAALALAVHGSSVHFPRCAACPSLSLMHRSPKPLQKGFWSLRKSANYAFRRAPCCGACGWLPESFYAVQGRSAGALANFSSPRSSSKMRKNARSRVFKEGVCLSDLADTSTTHSKQKKKCTHTRAGKDR